MCKYGNPRKQSSFICLRCLQFGISGIQRKCQREKYHVKDLFCAHCKMECKHIEIRYCDWLEEISAKAEELHTEYYGTV